MNGIKIVNGDCARIQFSYNPILVNDIKTMVCGSYFQNDTTGKYWMVKLNEKNIYGLCEYAKKHKFNLDPAINEVIKNIKELTDKKKENIELSKSLGTDIEIPKPDGVEYLPFQKSGIQYIDQVANGRCMVSDEMGCGKSIETIGYINLHPEIKKILVISPVFLKINWQRELNKWLVIPRDISIITAKNYHSTEVMLINYDILEKHTEALKLEHFDLIVFDEFQYIKNSRAKRTKSALKIARKVKKILALSGTPIMNRPVEAWTMLHLLDKEEFKNWKYYVQRYCGAYHNGFGWDVSGASNLNELGDKLRSKFMIRRLKKDVLKDLPAKRRILIEMEVVDQGEKLIADEQVFITKVAEISENRKIESKRIAMIEDESERNDAYKKQIENMKAANQFIFTEMERLRQKALGVKLPHSIEYIRNMVEEKGKVVVFAHHHSAIETLTKEFGNEAVTVYGSTSDKDRDNAVIKFQSDNSCKVFIGSIKAAGVGITLTAASDVIFLEQDWTPSWMSQCEDRCHRIGAVNAVTVYNLVVNGSIETHMVKMLHEKQAIMDAMLDSTTNYSTIANVSIFDELLNAVK